MSKTCPALSQEAANSANPLRISCVKVIDDTPLGAVYETTDHENRQAG